MLDQLPDLPEGRQRSPRTSRLAKTLLTAASVPRPAAEPEKDLLGLEEPSGLGVPFLHPKRPARCRNPEPSRSPNPDPLPNLCGICTRGSQQGPELSAPQPRARFQHWNWTGMGPEVGQLLPPLGPSLRVQSPEFVPDGTAGPAPGKHSPRPPGVGAIRVPWALARPGVQLPEPPWALLLLLAKRQIRNPPSCGGKERLQQTLTKPTP